MRTTEVESKEQSRFARLVLAQQFFELATGANPTAIRASMSRLYYANYHLAVALTGRTSHGDIAKRLEQSFTGLGIAYKNMRDLRSSMDYKPVSDELAGKNPLELLSWYTEKLTEGTTLFYQLQTLIAQKEGDKA